MIELNEAYRILISTCTIILGVCIFFSLIRAIIGPKTADRIVSVNMIGTMTIIIIALLSVYLNESYLLDVAIIYAMISFLAVVVLTKVYMGVERERLEKIAAEKKKEKDEQENEEKEVK